MAGVAWHCVAWNAVWHSGVRCGVAVWLMHDISEEGMT